MWPDHSNYLPCLVTEHRLYSSVTCIYCVIIINHGVLIFKDFIVHLNHENYNPNEIQFSYRLLPVVFETTNLRTHGSMHFVETTKIGANE
jgi:hypothetical protein